MLAGTAAVVVVVRAAAVAGTGSKVAKAPDGYTASATVTRKDRSLLVARADAALYSERAYLRFGVAMSGTRSSLTANGSGSTISFAGD